MLPSLVTDIDNLFTSVSSIWLRFFEDTCPPPSGPQFPIVATTIDFPLRTYKIGVANLEEFSQFGTVSRPSYEQAVLFRPIMVELFPAGFPQTPERVIVPILHVSTQKVPTLEALHRPSLTETGPACGIFTRFICNGLNQLKLFKQSRFFRVAQVRHVSDRTTRLLSTTTRSIQKNDAMSDYFAEPPLKPDKQISLHPARQTSRSLDS